MKFLATFLATLALVASTPIQNPMETDGMFEGDIAVENVILSLTYHYQMFYLGFIYSLKVLLNKPPLPTDGLVVLLPTYLQMELIVIIRLV